MAQSLEPTVARIGAVTLRCCPPGQRWSGCGPQPDHLCPGGKALALNGQHTFFINAAVMLWKGNAITRGTGRAAGVEAAIASFK